MHIVPNDLSCHEPEAFLDVPIVEAMDDSLTNHGLEYTYIAGYPHVIHSIAFSRPQPAEHFSTGGRDAQLLTLCCATQGLYLSTELGANASAWEFLTGLENMPNVGTVSVDETANVTLGDGNNANTSVWDITFTSAVGNFPSLEVRTLNEPQKKRLDHHSNGFCHRN